MTSQQDVRTVLSTILDPEMPVNLVDLGIVHAVDVQPRSADSSRAAPARGSRGLGTRSALPGDVHAWPAAADRPADTPVKPLLVRVEITPTFVGCPALDMIRGLIEDRVGDLPDVGEVDVEFIFEPPWSTDNISDAGREALRRHGVTVPPRGAAGALTRSSVTPLTVAGVAPVAACPYCGSDRTRRESPFGPTRCRMIYYCDACRNQFEHLKPI